MRNNQPVTRQEYRADPKRPIVSKTDLKGRITYVNRAFIQISGFSEQELLGQPHNLIRHPDMPPAAYADLWQTILSGHPWRGLVKNRSKDGGYYWVDAYVTPLKENGTPTGYMSIRTAPSRADIDAAEQLYAAVRADRLPFPVTRQRRAPSLDRLLLAGLLPPLLILIGQQFLPSSQLTTGLDLLVIAWLSGGAWQLHRMLAAPLAGTLGGIGRLTEADFSRPFTPGGCAELLRMQESLETMRINIRALLADVVSRSEDVNQAAAEAHGQATDLHGRSSEALAGIARIAEALSLLSDAAGEIARTTHDGADHANQATRLATEGESQMNHTIKATRQVLQAFHDTREAIGALQQSVSNIGSVATVIQGIADQTNLLALNAAIEAARAGEAGRGFAVVADEVRKLAERTSGNTAEIEQSITTLDQQAGRVIERIDAALGEVEAVETAVAQIDRSLGSIRQASHGVAAAANTVDDMLHRQSSSSSEVAQRMEAMRQQTEQNGHSIAAVNGIAAQLHDTARDLQLLLSRFARFL